MNLLSHITIPLLLATALAMTGCGSSSGTSTATVEVISPADDSSYSAGGTVEYSLRLINFTLAPPHDVRSSLRHHDEEGEGHAHDEEEHQHDDEMGEHDHDSDLTNPLAREGHYHVYLDAAEGSDDHLTAWTESGSFQLPHHISVGTHSLRFELRDNNHMRLGTAGSEAVVFFEVVEQGHHPFE